jgi:two-component system response regulator AtoC
MIVRAVIALEDPKMLRDISRELSRSDVIVDRVGQARTAWDQILRKGGDVVIVSESLVPAPFERSMAYLNQLPETPSTVVLTPSDAAEDHADLLACGCDTVLYSKLPMADLISAIEPTIEGRRNMMQGSVIGLQASERPRMSDFISESLAMQVFMQMAHRVASSNTPLLILGETGVGKEHLARAIHAESPRSAGPFVAINCAALPEQLLESELFGHEEGAFTGATRSRRGAFEVAHGGTLFLDEIGELQLHLQAKLLRVLQDLEIRRVGGDRTVKVDVRVMAASNRDLAEEVGEHRFRSDLYFRLNIMELAVPPLRERREDIPRIAKSAITRIAPRIGVGVREITPEALDCLCRYDWPGNMRELVNVLERAMLLCEEDTITASDLSANITGPGPYGIPAMPSVDDVRANWQDKSLQEVCREALEQVEKAYLSMVLTSTRGRVGLAAKQAGIHPRGLYNKMRKLGLRKEDFRS